MTNITELYDLTRNYRASGKFADAAAFTLKLIAADPDNAQALHDLGNDLMRCGEQDEAVACLKKAGEIEPDNPAFASSFLFGMHNVGVIDRNEIFAGHLQWGKRFRAVEKFYAQSEKKVSPSNKIRVGYVSRDFRAHSVAFFFYPLLKNHDRDSFEIFGYSNVKCRDGVTEQFENSFDHWRDISELDDAAASKIIFDDRIDILVDLGGHSGGNRLGVFARRPAPVQVTYLGYPDTTGLTEMDYRLTDGNAESDDAQKFYTEKLAYLDNCFLCWQPVDVAGEIADLPAIKNGLITFGSFNSSCKINDITIGLWASVLNMCKDSRLILKFPGGDDPGVQDSFNKKFEAHSIDRNRIEFFGWVDDRKHFELYSKIDIGLDTFPYNGTTTTCEALWMGVPVISLRGDVHASRVGASLLGRVGLEFFAADSDKQFTAKAVGLAMNIEALAKIRSTMRNRILASGFCDGDNFARKVEDAFAAMLKE